MGSPWRWGFFCVVAAVCVFCFVSSTPLIHLGKRFVHSIAVKTWLNQLPDDHHDNIWQSYVEMLAKEKNMTDCYVCSVIPKSTRKPTLYVSPMNKSQATCFASYALHFMPATPDNTSDGTIVMNRVCSGVTPLFTSSNVTGYPSRMKAVLKPGMKHPVCIHSPPGNWTVRVGHVSGCQQNITDLFPNSVCPSRAEISIPCSTWTPQGNYPTEGGWFLCGGHNIYPSLPVNWSGTCAPVFVSDHTIIVSTAAVQSQHLRQRRSTRIIFKSHDPLWGSNVPSEHKHWSTAEKVGLSFFPWIGEGKSMLMIETLDYRMKTGKSYHGP